MSGRERERERAPRLKRRLLILLWWMFTKSRTPHYRMKHAGRSASSLSCCHAGVERLSACITGVTIEHKLFFFLLPPANSGNEANEIIRELSFTLALSHARTHTLEESGLLPSWFTLPHKTHTLPHSWQPLRAVYCGTERAAGMLVWRVELCLCFYVFLVVSAHSLSSDTVFGTRRWGFSGSDIQPTGCQFHLSCSMLFSTLAVQDSDACLWNFLCCMVCRKNNLVPQ